MRIVVVNDTFTRAMGYTENLLPKALAKLGHDVHVVAGNLHAYHNSPDYADVYEPFLGPAIQPIGVEEFEGFLLHRLDHRMVLGYPALRLLSHTLRHLRPDVVQTLSVATWVTLQVAIAQPRRGFSLFTGAHQTPSVLPDELLEAHRWARVRLISDFRRAVPGRMVSTVTERCFAASEACAQVATQFYGVPREKIEVSPVGSDTDRFKPTEDGLGQGARQRLRADLGLDDNEIACIYTGRFTKAKDPLCLAHAIGRLREAGEPFRGLFVGDGPQADAIAAIGGCQVRPFLAWDELSDWYRAADVGVWPRQESLSMLDAAASGLPVVVSKTMGALERIEGSGLTYREGDADDLEATLLRLRDPRTRAELSREAVRKVRTRYSWDVIARARAERYESALEGRWLGKTQVPGRTSS